jgi:hypothetical protein
MRASPRFSRADRYVLLSEGGKAEAVVLLGIVLGSDPEEAAVEKAQRARQHLPATEVFGCEV